MKKTNTKNTKERTRIHDWFLGMMDNEPVTFKFTYSWNVNEQVIVKSDIYTNLLSLADFLEIVIPKKIGYKYVSVSGR